MEESTRVIGACRKCRRVMAAEGRPVFVGCYDFTLAGLRLNRRIIQLPRKKVTRWSGTAPCQCGEVVKVASVEGVISDTPCDERCTGARGHKCECSCGGEHHGRDNVQAHGLVAA